MQSSSPMDASTLRNPWQRASRSAIAKCGAQEEQPPTGIHYQERTTTIKTALKPRQEKDAYHLLTGQARCCGTTAFRPQQLNAHMHRKLKSFLPQRVTVVRRTRKPSMFFRDVTDTNQSESHSGHQQVRFTRNYMGAWRT